MEWGMEKYTPVYLYQARRVNTQDAAGPATLHTRISMNPGQVGRLVHMHVRGTLSGGSTLQVLALDEDGATVGSFAGVAAGANLQTNLPSVGAIANASTATGNSVGMLFGPGEYLSMQSSVSLITEILTVGIVLLLSTPDIPIWDTTGSGGTPNLAASTISAVNTLQRIPTTNGLL